MKRSRSFLAFLRQLKEFGVLEDVRDIALWKHGVTLSELYEKQHHKATKVRRATIARGEVLLYLRKKFDWSGAVLGKLFDRNHASCYYAMDEFERSRDEIERAAAEAQSMVPKEKT